MILFTSRLEAAGRADTADLYVRRNLWLVVLGFANAFGLLWFGDILYSYGLIALVLFPFRKLAPAGLLTLGVAALLASAAWNYWDTRNLLLHRGLGRRQPARKAGPEINAEQQAASRWEGARHVQIEERESRWAAKHARRLRLGLHQSPRHATGKLVFTASSSTFSDDASAWRCSAWA